MKINSVVVGPLDTNCYILNNNGKVIIIDPGDEEDKIINEVNGEVVGIIITHHHFDHVGAMEEIKKYYKVNVYDYSNLKENNKIDNFDFKMIRTPGHTDDSITIYFEKEKSMFVGDFIFYGSIGRTDLGGNISDMKKSIESILLYDDDIKLYPGHFIPTKIGIERNNLINIIRNF
jgi:hypothetical protein